MPPNGGILVARDYQYEMVRESRKRNIICVAGTGTGKTTMETTDPSNLFQYTPRNIDVRASAILRIRDELEAQTDAKLVWFLCPTIALAEQQARVLKQNLPSWNTRVLCGKDGVDGWTTQDVWDRALYGINVVVATHAVLRDAMVHAFVTFDRICLLVFDEAHHAVDDHPAGLIMKFYHAAKRQGKVQTKILGLTASPIKRKDADTEALTNLEQNLDAVIRTPVVNREQLLEFTHRPAMLPATYPVGMEREPLMLSELRAVYSAMDIEEDPYVKIVKAGNRAKYFKAIEKKKTYCHQTMRSLVRTASEVCEELGPWLCEHYIMSCIRRIFKPHDSIVEMNLDIVGQETEYLTSLLGPLRDRAHQTSYNDISPKVGRLIELLRRDMSQSRCIIFMKTRASVYLLDQLLSSHPDLHSLVRSGTFVGSSEFSNRGNSLELLDPRDQKNALTDFSSGKLNVLICTSVAEEGIDITACNLVVCFELPPNLKAFVQRRGRARQAKSKYVLFVPGHNTDVLRKWTELEEEMTKAYMDEMRELDRIRGIEDGEGKDMVFEVSGTGARLTLHESIPHLMHFSQKLPQMTDPIFSFHGHEKAVACEVTLPVTLDISLRSFSSVDAYLSQNMARRDAAFQALVGLHRAGLLNDHLLPFPRVSEAMASILENVKKRSASAPAVRQMLPWVEAAAAWADPHSPRLYHVEVAGLESEPLPMRMFSSFTIGSMDFPLYLDSDTILHVTIAPEPEAVLNAHMIKLGNEATRLLLSTKYSHRMQDNKTGFPLLFVPAIEQLGEWIHQMTGTYPASELSEPSSSTGIVRDMANHGSRHVLEAVSVVVPADTGPNESQTILACKPMGRRADFLHPIPQDQSTAPRSSEVLDPDTCVVDRLPLRYAQFARLIPSIMHCVEIRLVATALKDTLFAPVNLTDSARILEAISTAQAQEGKDYEALELLGDTVLKVLTSLALMAEYPMWTEGDLSGLKSQLVSNERLANASDGTGLTKYILTRAFTGAKWRPLYNDDLLHQPSEPHTMREMSTKVIADVSEALIGAAWLDGDGFDKAIEVLRILMPEVSWRPVPVCAATLLERAETCSTLARPLTNQLEELFDKSFSRKSLLVEAVTHPNHLAGPTRSSIRSYDRLEFLGDALLDYVVCTRFSRSPKALSVPRMHLLKTAAVSAGHLAYRALTTTIATPHNELETVPIRDASTHKMTTSTTFTHADSHRCLLDFLRYSPDATLTGLLNDTRARFEALKPLLDTALSPASDRYPWALLIALGPHKVVSDLVESAIGAVWMESSGDFAAVEKLLERFGILQWLDNAIERDVHVWHPKEQAGVLMSRYSQGKSEVEYVISEYQASAEEQEEAGDRGDQGKWVLGKGNILCQLYIGGEMLSEARGWFRIHAETRAAELAIGVLQAKPLEPSHATQAADPVVQNAQLDGGHDVYSD